MTVGRILTLGRGARLVPVLLIGGIPRVYTPAGIRPTSVAVRAGTTVDPLFWPGTGTLTETLPDASTFDPVRDLLDPKAVWEVYEQLDPLKGEARVESMRLELYDDGDRAGAMLSARGAYPTRLLTADISASALSVPLSSVAGLPASGIASVGRETFLYDSISGSTLVVPTGGRGRYGSVARAHASSNLRQPVVSVGGPRHPQGRAASVWVCELSADGTTLQNPTLLFYGQVGPGIQLVRGGLRWSVPIDHMTVTATARISGREIELWGINHHTRPAGPGARTPLYALAQGPTTTSEVFLGPTDEAGWHPSWSAFADDWRVKAAAAVTAGGPRVDLATAGQVRVTGQWGTGGSGSRFLEVVAEWAQYAMLIGDAPQTWTSDKPAPQAYIPLDGWVTIPSPDDLAKIPATLSYLSSAPYTGTATLALVADTDESEGVFVELLGRNGADSKVRVRLVGRTSPDGRFVVYDGNVSTLCTKPTVARVGIVGRGPEAWGALRAMALAVAALDGLDTQVDAIDWEHLARQARQAPLPAALSEREYRIGPGEDSLLGILADELRLRGMILSVRHGRITGLRYGHFSATERTAGHIAEADVLQDAEWELMDQPAPAAVAIRYTLRDGGSYQVTDATWVSELGAGQTIQCQALRWLPQLGNLAEVRAALNTAAQQTLGPLAEPARHLTLPLSGQHLALQPGDLVTLTHSRVPNFTGTRGLTNATAQVIAVRRQYFGGRIRANVVMRLSSEEYQGYAPSALVAAGGFAGAVVTVDTSSGFGASGFADDGQDPTDGFAAGDVVELCEIGVKVPGVAREQRTVVSVTATTITLSAAPSAPMAALAAAQYRVMIRYAGHGDVVAAQYPYAFLSDTTPDLPDGSVDRYAP